jgi:uncharacterized repeat protein (TIGR03803 family)
MSKLSLWKAICFVCAFCLLEAIASPAQTFTILASFDLNDGAYPLASVVQGSDGNLYGTTSAGGANGSFCIDNCGTVFRITPAGELTTLYSFCSQANCADGALPEASLVLGADGNLYGTTLLGGANSAACDGLGCGTVFKITAAGKITTLYSFCSQANCADGANPGAVVQAIDGNFYGITGGGGSSACNPDGDGCGTVFKINAAGKLTTLYSFCSQANCADGALPLAMVQDTDGTFYGTTLTSGIGSRDLGTVFKITPAGRFRRLHTFAGADGTYSYGLTLGTDGNFYGTSGGGGAHNNGFVFRITAAGKLTTLYSFCSRANCADGSGPEGELIQATGGNLYGTTNGGGDDNLGTIFKITLAGKLTRLHSFDIDSEIPVVGLLQGTDGTFYGTTLYGGGVNCEGGCGTVFSLSTGLGPFVSFVRGEEKVDKIVEILGQGFAGTTGVSFNGTPAVFKVISSTFLKATVRQGATTGPVTVTAPSGSLTSNVPFRVRPQILSFSPTSGPVGTQVMITGVSLTQTTKVNFNGARATNFTVNSDTQVAATVPTGAHGHGPIAITTAGGKTWSKQNFTVTH